MSILLMQSGATYIAWAGYVANAPCFNQRGSERVKENLLGACCSSRLVSWIAYHSDTGNYTNAGNDGNQVIYNRTLNRL